MALTAPVKSSFKQALCNPGATAELVAAIDDDTGTISADTERVLKTALGLSDRTHFLAKVNSGAGGTMVGFAEHKIRQLCGKARGQEIIDEIAGNA